MIYIEMSRDQAHGGGTWGFTNCVWSPSKKVNGGDWPFWSKILKIQTEDIIFHLRGKQPNAKFIGFSFAAGDGFETTKRPPNPKEWGYSNSFLRADLKDFTQFIEPISLNDVFLNRRKKLETYFDNNRLLKSEKQNIFFVRQSNRLQCLNGAYLSDVDEELFEILFGNQLTIEKNNKEISQTTIETGTQIAYVRTRIGQSLFAKEIKSIYNTKCCFPGCEISDNRFLVSSHIARWSDNEQLRGNLGNGLCLCLIHDKAFELGLFTLDENFAIFVNPKEIGNNSQIVKQLLFQQGKQIKLGKIHPNDDALLEHWIRVDISP